MAGKRRKRQGKGQGSRRKLRRGFVWVRGPIGPSGRRKPGHWRKLPSKKPEKTLPSKDGFVVVSGYTKKNGVVVEPYYREVKKTETDEKTSKAKEIRRRFSNEPFDNVWVKHYPERKTYHERWRVPPVTKKLQKFLEPYGDINAHLTAEFVDKETGEVVYRSTPMVAANEIDLAVNLLDKMLNKYASAKILGPVSGFELWLHDNPDEFSKRNLIF